MGKAQKNLHCRESQLTMTSSRIIRIATRSSPLALWQANTVKRLLEANGNACELVLIESTGDLQLTQPLYAMGISGVFTKQLDVALLNSQADIAVHSLKDVPTQLAEGLFLCATLERGSFEDVALYKDKDFLENSLSDATIATSSLRRRAQWLAKYPKHKMSPIRGNVQTRLRKFAEGEELKAVIFAKAGLERMNLLPENHIVLDWMLPAPAQGIVGIVCRENDNEMREVCNAISNKQSFITGTIERQFLKTLLGGCSVPISALAKIVGDRIHFRAAMHDFDGSKFYAEDRVINLSDWQNAGKETAEKLLQQHGAVELLEAIRNKNWNEEGSVN